jgi:hypothetical protein
MAAGLLRTCRQILQEAALLSGATTLSDYLATLSGWASVLELAYSRC